MRGKEGISWRADVEALGEGEFFWGEVVLGRFEREDRGMDQGVEERLGDFTAEVGWEDAEFKTIFGDGAAGDHEATFGKDFLDFLV